MFMPTVSLSLRSKCKKGSGRSNVDATNYRLDSWGRLVFMLHLVCVIFELFSIEHLLFVGGPSKKGCSKAAEHYR